VQINVEVPEEFVLERGAAAMARRLKLYAALRMFQSGELSAGGAGQLADLDRFTFAAECKRHGIPRADSPAEELGAELESIRRAC
jgi:predicted HTH domain antitoxin